MALALLALPASFSQGFQDLRLRRILQELSLDRPDGSFFVEFGWRGLYGANTHALSVRGWNGVRFDGQPPKRDTEKYNVRRAMITSRNIVSLFRDNGVPTNVTYVSIDIDSADIWLLRELLKSEYKPAVLTVEYNPNYPWGYPLAFPDLEGDSEQRLSRRARTWDGSCYMGSSAEAIAMAARQLGYSAVDVEPGLDIFLVRGDLWGRRFVPELGALPTVHRLINLNYEGGQSMDGERVGALIDYAEFVRSGGDHAAARRTVPALVERLRGAGNPCFAGRQPANCSTYFKLELYSRVCLRYNVHQWLPIGGFALGQEVLSAWVAADYATLTDGGWRRDRSCASVFCDPELTNVSLHSSRGDHPTNRRTARCCRELALSRDSMCPERPDGICRKERYRSVWHGEY